MTRRDFISVPAQGVSAAVIAAIGGSLVEGQTKLQVPLRFFTGKQAAIIEAACERIMPADESGPGAKDAGVVIYIDRQLAGPYGHDKYRFIQAPFFESVSEHGYQGKENPRELYTAGLGLLSDFLPLTPAQQDERLVSMERSLFFQMLRTHTVEGMFCDPLHGGNVGMAGWKMIGFPGPYMSWRDEIDQHFGEAFRPAAKSLVQIAGRPVKGMEDEPV
ncbi:MAG: gluconate 2-dehydrogenase gamma chain [Bryobacterales bacterium]|jgi:gluconate 2-dehydrogenase gamma chain|nr:gluconate 2-dehydrogenase gamma chain [Bryobacterales bacterium]